MSTKVVLNEDKNLVEEIRKQIKINEGHCCCAVVFTDDNLCPCKDFREKIQRGELGYCECTLYNIIEDPKQSL